MVDHGQIPIAEMLEEQRLGLSHSPTQWQDVEGIVNQRRLLDRRTGKFAEPFWRRAHLTYWATWGLARIASIDMSSLAKVSSEKMAWSCRWQVEHSDALGPRRPPSARGIR